MTDDDTPAGEPATGPAGGPVIRRRRVPRRAAIGAVVVAAVAAVTGSPPAPSRRRRAGRRPPMPPTSLVPAPPAPAQARLMRGRHRATMPPLQPGQITERVPATGTTRSSRTSSGTPTPPRTSAGPPTSCWRRCGRRSRPTRTWTLPSPPATSRPAGRGARRCTTSTGRSPRRGASSTPAGRTASSTAPIPPASRYCWGRSSWRHPRPRRRRRRAISSCGTATLRPAQAFFATADEPCTDARRMLHVWTADQVELVGGRDQPVEVEVVDPFGAPFRASVARAG